MASDWRFRSILSNVYLDLIEEGILTLSQVREAIVSCDEEVDDKVLDYMLYYVFIRSQSADRMEYKTII